MPTVQDLQRLRALLQILDSFGNVQRGELIRAENWNALVGAVADVARSVLAAEAEPVIPLHDHLDQVTQAWLAPRLRDLVDNGALSDPAAQSRLSSTELAVKRLGARLDASSKMVEEFKGRLTDVSTNDLERQAAVIRVSRALDNVIDPRPDLQAFRNTLASVQKDLSTVQEAASKLIVNGQIIDVGQVAGLVSELEKFRDSFKSATGEILDAAAIERRFAEISVRFVTPDDLTATIKSHQFEISEEQLAGLEGRVATDLTNQLNARFSTFQTEFTGAVDRRLEGVGDLVGSRLNDALPAVTQNLTAALQPKIDAVQKAAVDSAVAAAQQSINTRENAIRADFNALLADVRASVQVSVRTEVAQSLASQLSGIQSSLASAQSKIDALSTRAGKADEFAQSQAAAIAKLTQDTATLKNDMRTSLLAELELRVQAVNRSIDDKLTAFSKTQNERLEAVSRDITTKALDEARRVATEAATTATATTRAQLLAEMRSVAREEASSAIQDQVKLRVTEAVKEQFSTVPGLISEEVRKTVGTSIATRPTGVGISPGRVGTVPGGGPR